jgi:hypothetical protein
MKQATWYYCPQAYPEFKIPRFDSANMQKVLEKLKPAKEMGAKHAEILFAGAQPSTVQAQAVVQALPRVLACTGKSRDAGNVR